MLVCLLTIACTAGAEEPFWRAKEKAYARIREGEILVSVRGVKNSAPPPANALKASGGGAVMAPRAFVFEIAQQFERAARASDYVKSASFDPAKNALTMDVEAYGHKARMVVELLPRRESEPWRVDYVIREGPMAGMAGQVTFTAVGKACEVGFTGDYKYETFQAPKIFLEFGFEVVLQKMAARLRAFTEDEWRKSRAPGKPAAAVDRRGSLWNNPAHHG